MMPIQMLCLILIATLAQNCHALDVEKKASQALTSASASAGIEIPEVARTRLMKKYRDLPQQTQQAIAASTAEQLQAGLQRYFSLKSKEPTVDSFEDFRWEYATTAQDLTGVTLVPAENGQVSEVRAGEHLVLSHLKMTKDVPVSFVVPKSSGSFKLLATTHRGESITWRVTGFPSDGTVSAPKLLPKQCMVEVKSTPDGAEIFFNDLAYYKATNCKSVRDSGKYKIRVVKEGFVDHEEEIEIKEGETVTINASLKKK